MCRNEGTLGLRDACEGVWSDKGRAPALVGRCVLAAFVSKRRLKLKDPGLEAGNDAGVACILFRYRFRYRCMAAVLEAVLAHALCNSHRNFADRWASHGRNPISLHVTIWGYGARRQATRTIRRKGRSARP